MSHRGTSIMIDGIDGSGKSTIIQTWQDTLIDMGKRVFSLKQYMHDHQTLPTVAELEPFDVILSAEPTYVWVGAAIRAEMINHATSYTTTAIAEAYALDRLVLYTRLILPLLAQGKTVIQDRGVSTSLCYQSVQDNPLSLEDIASIEGNTFALAHAPDHLFLTHIPPAEAMQRLGKRDDKQDNAMFEQQAFLQKAHDRFHSELFQGYFSSKGTTIHTLHTNQDIDEMKQTAQRALTHILA